MRAILILATVLSLVQGNTFLLFKKNQWQVNKVLKKTDEAMRSRLDVLQNTIIKQNSLIEKLVERLDALETEILPNEKDKFSNLDMKIKLLEESQCSCEYQSGVDYNDNEHADFLSSMEELIADVNVDELVLDETSTLFGNMSPIKAPVISAPKPASQIKAPKRATQVPAPKPFAPKPVPQVTAPKPFTPKPAPEVSAPKPTLQRAFAPKPIAPEKQGIIVDEIPAAFFPMSAKPEPEANFFPMPVKVAKVPELTNLPLDQIFLDDSLGGANENVNSLFSSLLRKLKQKEGTPKTTPAPLVSQFVDGENCIQIPQIEETSGAFVHTSWVNGGAESISFNAFAFLPLSINPPTDGKIIITFSAKASSVEVWEAIAKPYSEDGTQWIFSPNDGNVYLQEAGGTWKFNFIATVESSTASMSMEFCRDLIVPDITLSADYPDYYMQMDVAPISVEPEESEDSISLDYGLISGEVVSLDSLGLTSKKPVRVKAKRPASRSSRCTGVLGRPVTNPKQSVVNFTPAPEDETAIFGYDLNEAISKSIMFYEAQRSGELPKENRILWRGDSVLRDGCDIGVDLSKGWFDAGDHVKYTFPAAFTTTMLVWSIIDYPDAYESANEMKNALDQVKWGLDWLLKAHISPNELVVMVGDPQSDHARWGSPEDMRLRRPTYTVNAENPGTEPAAETAAAMAAGSILFKDVDPEYSEKLLTSSKQLMEFADRNRMLYHKSVPEVVEFYKSWSGYEDELCWATAWLYKATNSSSYGRLAKYYYTSFNCGKKEESFDWDKKHAGVQLLMAQITGEQKYFDDVAGYANFLLDVEKKTPGGLIWFHKWGSLRIANNWGAFLLGASKLVPKLPRADEYAMIAIDQIGYALGDKGRSYVQGFGVNPPLRSHHRAASCPKAPTDCSNMLYSDQPNYWILYGALVGGPNQNDQYADKREDYVMNEVAIDYNAGFQYSLAALKSILLSRN